MYKRFVAVLSLVALGASGCDPDKWTEEIHSLKQVGGRPFHTDLSGANEVPGPGDPDGNGHAVIILNQGQGLVCFELSVSNILLPASAAHIHVGGEDVAGPVVVGLSPAPDESGSSQGCVEADAQLIKTIRQNPEEYYVNVHNADFPAGAVRGQLSK
jgi:hypothetical protein